ncbi:late endosomal/lysosomal adaptor, MAPK and MTOR activator 4 [Lycorma delicatula]|uniref:late endosomal/lysosomal adaptor, MAPK and MTOR activator 4 n=1 Tax=Lycorma delicatula TaxID=130591 RepID=UPI003F5122B4
MMALERIPDQVGYLVLNEDGAVICSGGELENSEHVANIVLGMITLSDSVGPDNEGYKKISVIYQDFCYIICLSNKKIYVVKKRYLAPKSPVLIPETTILNTNLNSNSNSVVNT